MNRHHFPTESSLLEHAARLEGRSLASLLKWAFPSPLTPAQRGNKGLLGQALDRWFGVAPTGHGADFPELAIELKSIPLSLKGKPCESTFITTANLKSHEGWEGSAVFKKTQRVLWVPYLADHRLPWEHRLFFRPFLWSPSAQEMETLRNDWEELKEGLSLGFSDHMAATHGEFLQLRPKGQNRWSRSLGYDEFGEAMILGPKAFYLRRSFTERLFPAMPTAGIEPAAY